MAGEPAPSLIKGEDLFFHNKMYKTYEDFLINEVYVPTFRFVRSMGSNPKDLRKGFDLYLWLESMAAPYLDRWYYTKRNVITQRLLACDTGGSRYDRMRASGYIKQLFFLMQMQLKVTGVFGRGEYEALF